MVSRGLLYLSHPERLSHGWIHREYINAVAGGWMVLLGDLLEGSCVIIDFYILLYVTWIQANHIDGAMKM